MFRFNYFVLNSDFQVYYGYANVRSDGFIELEKPTSINHNQYCCIGTSSDTNGIITIPAYSTSDSSKFYVKCITWSMGNVEVGTTVGVFCIFAPYLNNNL